MKYLKVKKIFMKEDSNIIRRNKQSKCTCHVLLEDQNNEEYLWVCKNEHIANMIKKIGENEEKKYGKWEDKPWLLGRYMFFLSWLYEFYEKYLTHYGFKPPIEHVEKAKRFKRGKYENKD